VALVKVADGPAIGNNIPFEAPFVAQSVKEQVIRARRFAAHGVVRAHYRIGLAFHNRGAKRGSIGVRKIVRGNRHIKAMPQNFRAAVDGKVLGCRDCFQIARIIALQAGNEGHSDAAGEIRIFAVGFLAASPTRIAKNIDIRRPEGEAVIAASVSMLDGVVIFGPRFRGNHIGDTMDQICIPSGCEADGLGKDGCIPRPRHAVQALVPPVVRRNAEAGNCWRHVLHLRDLLFQGHARNQIVHALLQGKARVEICGASGFLRRGSVRRSLCSQTRLAEGQAQNYGEKSKRTVFHGEDSRLLDACSPVVVRDRRCQPLANFGKNIPVCFAWAANFSPNSSERKDSSRRAFQ